ncbi:glycosyltransferase [Erythrobacter sp. THAF29]|uniref:glycosyltransferase n=1 Tax=Erythrobacter sp. THAF29 TaxID=2587851 RepID=UPI001269268D|nr:glycosyltransferase [Erythrobacter sp. THAF29]QFT76858.1 Beta-monoglucosyldiacylglycerol synthase [Erythrobacter sp. THAF29]
MLLTDTETLSDGLPKSTAIESDRARAGRGKVWAAQDRKPWLFLFIFGCWTASLIWFGPRLLDLVISAETWTARLVLGYFALFTPVAWLYGLYNVGVVLFAAIYRNFVAKPEPLIATSHPPIAMLYTTCNDFVWESAQSCLDVDYPDFTLYLLDDSSDPACRDLIDEFAAQRPDRIKVIRRENRTGFKAGNLNNALRNHVREPYFAVIDADEILPVGFLRQLVPYLQNDPDCGFVQANHRCEEDTSTQLQEDMRIGIDVHWKWYQPLRNKFGFVMFLGHGALLRRSCWEEVGGFDEIVSEDLAYAISIREQGYYGIFAEDVVCSEAFPETVRAFRVRHVKWTRGTCEFLHKWTLPLIRSRRIPLIEKLDILFPTANLPLTFFFFVFMLIAGLGMPFLLGQQQTLTWVIAGQELSVPVRLLPPELTKIFTPDFFAITVLTLFAPILCFILEHWRRPLRLWKFLSRSTALYAALSPLSAICVAGYALTGKARFLVTGDTNGHANADGKSGSAVGRYLSETHPDSMTTWSFEIIAGALFLAAAFVSFQPAFAGLALAFLMQPYLHGLGWSQRLLRIGVMIPFTLIVASVLLGSASLLGLQPVLFGFGFHF